MHCESEGLRECEVGNGLAIMTSVAHAPLPQTGRKLALTLHFPPPRGCKSGKPEALNLKAAWADSEENGWKAAGREETKAHSIPWVIDPCTCHA